MKKILCILCATVIIFSALSFCITAQVKTYKDVKDNVWYSQYVYDCAEKGLMVGTSDTTFSPDVSMTRAMFVQALYNYYKTYIKGTENDVNSLDFTSIDLPFTDVDNSAYYIEALKWATATELTSGVTPTEFAPDAPVTREQTAVFFDRLISTYHFYYILIYAFGGEDSYYSDKSEISDYALKSVVNVIKGDLMSGYGIKFKPKSPTKRCEVATVFSKMESVVSAVKPEINVISFSGNRDFVLTNNEGERISFTIAEGPMLSGDMRVYGSSMIVPQCDRTVYVNPSTSYTLERNYAEELLFNVYGNGYNMTYYGSGKKITFYKGQEAHVYNCNNEDFQLRYHVDSDSVVEVEITGKSTSEITSSFKDGQVTINGLAGVGKVVKRDLISNQILFKSEINNGEKIKVF